MKRNIFKVFLNKFFEYPLWIKQAVYFEVLKDMKNNNCENSISGHAGKIFALSVPVLTYAGRNEIVDKKFCYDSNISNFLKFAAGGYSLLEISLNMYMSMEEISKLYLFCLEQGFIEYPEEKEVTALAGYVSGKLLTGEYFAECGVISTDELNEAITEQQNSNSIGRSKMIGQILVDSGFISKENLEVALSVKSQARCRFVVNPDIIPYSKPEFSETEILKKKIADLQNENKLLKSTMAKIVETVSHNDI